VDVVSVVVDASLFPKSDDVVCLHLMLGVIETKDEDG